MRLLRLPLHRPNPKSSPLLQRLLSKWPWKPLTLTMFRSRDTWAARMGRRTLLPRRNRRLRAPRKLWHPQWIRSRKTWRFSPMVDLAHEGADFSRVWTLRAR